MSSTGNTLPALLAQRASATPQAIAFQQDDGRGGWHAVTWVEFADRVRRLAARLHDAGLRHGDRLAIIAPVGLQWELVHHAALAVGAVVVGLDAHDLPARIATMAAQTGVKAFATSDMRCLSALSEADWQRTRFVLALGATAQVPAGVHRLDWNDAPASPSDAMPMWAVEPDDLATVIFTSGTTGEPKGIAYRHGQVCLAIDAIRDAFPFAGPGTRLLCWLPLSNLFQRIVNLAAMTTGATTYLWADPRRVMEALPRVEPDIFIGVPRFFEKLYEGITARIAEQGPAARALADWALGVGRKVSARTLSGLPSGAALRWRHAVADRLVLRRIRATMGTRLRCMVTGSAPTPKHLLEEFHALGWLVLEAYGMSESIVPMAMNRIDCVRLGSVGRPLASNQMVVDDAGAIKVRGRGVFRSYLSDEDRSLFDADGFYTTGDLGRFDKDGYLYLTGRSGELIKTSTGRRVAPAAVEAQLRRVPGIDQAALLGSGRKCLVAVCSLASSLPDAASREVLIAALLDQVGQINPLERPLGFVMLGRPFSIELGELTSNLKLRRQQIENRHAAVIAQLYETISLLSKTGSHDPEVIWLGADSPESDI